MNALQHLSSREYKVMLNHHMFADRREGSRTVCEELRALAGRLPKIKWQGELQVNKRRTIVFLDTIDRTIALNGLLLRQRTDKAAQESELTLKCRSADRYVAAGADLSAAPTLESCLKLEEDIGAPFVSRFSRSNTICSESEPPETLEAASKYFSVLNKLKRDGVRCSSELRLKPVNSLKAFERVLTGATLTLGDVEAEVALILWSAGRKGRSLVSEFSFRYKCKGEDVSVQTARQAKYFFEELQLLDWCAPLSMTKTQFAYGTN
jgi:hypothetical protein